MNAAGKSVPGPRPADRSGVPLDGGARRLLAALGAEGAYAFPDPTAPDALILRGGGGGVSLGGGRYPVGAARALVAAGLAGEEAGRRTRYVILAAGRSRLARAAADPDTAFLAQHLDLVTEAGGRTLRDASESPLAWLARRRGRDGAPLIDRVAYEAGERLRADMETARMLPRLGQDWSVPRVDGTGPRDPAAATDRALAAKQRVDRALAAAGSDLSGLLIDLCGFLKGLERIESEHGWPARSAKVVARIALGRLAEHYGLDRAAVGPDRGRLRRWRAAGCDVEEYRGEEYPVDGPQVGGAA